MSPRILCFLLLLLITGCNLKPANKPVKDSAEAVRKLMDADKAFSDLSEARGMKSAFIDYIDSNGVMLVPDRFPIVGADAIDYLSQHDDQAYTLTWEPRGGEVAGSGEIGYTYGVFSLRQKSNDSIQHGTYISVWKRQSNGNWKFVLNSGNDGTGE
jgi:ketosteroid isomerase-like protein